MYKADKNRVVTFGLKTVFGGGRSTGFALIYDDEASQKKFEPRHRLVRVCIIRVLGSTDKELTTTMCFQSGLAAKIDKPSRKLRKERKNRSKKVRWCRIASMGQPDSSTLFPSLVVPRSPKDQGLGGFQEEVDLVLHCVNSFSHFIIRGFSSCCMLLVKSNHPVLCSSMTCIHLKTSFSM